MSARTEKDFWDGLAAALSVSGEKRPTGKEWVEFGVLVRRWDITPSRTSERLKKAIAAGFVERFEGRKMKDGELVRCAWYRPKSAKTRL